MEKLNPTQLSWRDLIFAGIILLVIVFDQLSKLWIVGHSQLGEIIWDVGLFRIVHVQNTGAAFGLFSDHTIALIIVDFIGIFVILYLVILMRHRWPFIRHKLVMLGIALITGGLLGNMIDRIRLGYVTDFIDFKIWPVWNVADASTVIGTIILAYCLVFLANRSQITE